MDKYTRGKVLGKGSFGCAVLATNKLDGKNHVIKEVDMSRMPKAEREAAEQEAKLLMALNHPNIVRCSECFVHQNKLCIVMDWCSEGDLYCIMQKRKGQMLTEETIIDWFVQMCLGLKHVHDRKILHRDLKTQNVFMSAGGLLKLGDFGVSKILNSTFQLASTAVGTPYYLSPEICQNKRYNQKSDIWSLGCVLYEITTQKHAFEAPNMRALIQRIIKGTYAPLPSNRSKELRDLIASMLTLDSAKRPSINDVLAAPICKARITKFLSATLHANEFSHTIIHGRPSKGQLVVGADTSSSSSTAASSASAAKPGHAAAPTAAAAARAPLVPPPAGARPGSSPSPSAIGRGAASPKAAPKASPPVSRPDSAGRNGGPAAPSMSALAAQQQRMQDAAAAMKAKQNLLIKEREEAAAAVAAADRERAKKAQEVHANDQARKNAAVAASREVERMKLEEMHKKLEADRARMEGDRRKLDAKRLEDERKIREAEAYKAKHAGEAARKAKEEEARKAAHDAEARRKEAERQAREREREDARLKMAAQRQAFQAAGAPRNGTPEVRVADNGAARRKQWEDPVADSSLVSGGVVPEFKWDTPAKGAAEAGPTQEQRRALWEEQRAAAERNKAQNRNPNGGLAALLGVPTPASNGTPQPRAAPDAGRHSASPSSAEPSPDQRRQAYQELQEAARRNRAAIEGRPVSANRAKPGTPPLHSPAVAAAAGKPPSRGGPIAGADYDDPYERKRQKLEADRLRREQEILEYQRQHWQEMKAAAERNRRQLVADVRGGEPRPRTPSPSPSPPQGAKAGAGGIRASSPSSAPSRDARRPGSAGDAAKREAEEDYEFAAMVKDMQDVLGVQHGGAGNGHAADDGDDDDDEYHDEAHAKALAGQFVLNGEVVQLPVRDSDPLGAKVEALRCFLESKLGTNPFLKVYRRLESLTPEDDEAEVSRFFMEVLGADKLPYLQLVHQLIVCEESMQS